jgi:chromosome partitioning protein
MTNKTTLSEQVEEQIRKNFPHKVFETTIPNNVRVAEAPSFGLPVGSYDKRSKGAKAYKEVTQELVERIS